MSIERRVGITYIGVFKSLTAVALAIWGFTATSTQASVTYTGSFLGNDSGETNKASADFNLTISGTTTQLVVTLSNEATYTPNDQPDILTAVFFTLAGNPTLTRISGVLAPGSVGVENGTNLTVIGGVIGGSWVYETGLSGAPAGQNQGISSAGFGIFGGSVFPGAALPDDGPIPNGSGGGLTTIPDGGTSDGLNGRPYIKHAAVFTLGAVPASFTLANLSNITFQYGTALDEGNTSGTVIPEPSSIALAAVGLSLLGLLSRKRR